MKGQLRASCDEFFAAYLVKSMLDMVLKYVELRLEAVAIAERQAIQLFMFDHIAADSCHCVVVL